MLFFAWECTATTYNAFFGWEFIATSYNGICFFCCELTATTYNGIRFPCLGIHNSNIKSNSVLLLGSCKCNRQWNIISLVGNSQLQHAMEIDYFGWGFIIAAYNGTWYSLGWNAQLDHTIEVVFGRRMHIYNIQFNMVLWSEWGSKVHSLWIQYGFRLDSI